MVRTGATFGAHHFLPRPTQSATTATSARAGYLLPLLPFSALVLHIGDGGHGDFAGVFVFPPVVGYQNKGFDRSGYNISAISFETVGAARDEITLGDITPSDDFSNSFITFMTAGGATAKVSYGGKQVPAKYFYVTEDDAEDGAGWYLEADEDYENNQNAVILPLGDGFLVNRASGEASATLTFAGEVSTTPVTKSFSRAGYNITGNCTPTTITLGDITPSEDFSNSFITFMTAGGATAKVSYGGKQVPAKYFYVTEDDAEDGAGWYLEADEDYENNQNAVELQAGEGFLVNRASGEASATLTIPSAL